MKSWLQGGIAVAGCLAVAVAVWALGYRRAAAQVAAEPVLQEVSASRLQTELCIEILTDSGETVAYTTSSHRDPNRFVITLPGIRLSPALIPPSFGESAEVTGISVLAKDGDTPATDVVLELSIRPEDLLYRVDTETPGRLVVALRAPAPGEGKPAPAPPAPAKETAAEIRGAVPKPAVRRVASPITPSTPSRARRLRKPSERPTRGPARGPAPALGPGPPEAGSALAGAPSRPADDRRRTAGPQAGLSVAGPQRGPTGREQEPEARSSMQYAAWLLAAAAGAIGATLCWRLLYAKARARGRRLWVERGLSSGDEAEALAAVRSAKAWPAADLRRAEGVLCRTARDEGHPASRQARELLRSVRAVEALTDDLLHGRWGARLRAARLLTIHPAEEAVGPLLQAAASGPRRVRDAAVQSLAEMAGQGPVRPILAALDGADEASRATAAEAIRQAGAKSVAWLRHALLDPDPAVRSQAVTALLLVRPEGTAGLVAGLLADPSERVRAKAAEALGRLGPEAESSDALVAALGDASENVREAAAIALTGSGRHDLDRLLTALDRRACEHPDTSYSALLLGAIASNVSEPHPGVERALSSFNRSFAVSFAAALATSGVLDTWVSQLGTCDAEQREKLAAVLAAAARVGATESLLRGLESPLAQVAETCALILGEARTEGATGPLSRLLDHPEDDVRSAAARALAEVDSDESVAALVAALEDPAPAVRAASASSLGKALGRRAGTGDSDALDLDSVTAALLRSLRDPSPPVRSAVAHALGKAGPDDVIHELLDTAMRDEDEGVRSVATESVGRLGAYAVLPILLVESLNDGDPAVRLRAMEILAGAADPTAMEPMVGALQDADERVRAAAGRGLWDAVREGQSQPLVRFLASPDPKVRAGIAGALGKARAVEWVSALAQAADDPDPRVRAAIVNALGRMGKHASQHFHAIGARLADTDGFVRARAAEAVLAVAPSEENAARCLLPLAADPEPDVRQTAVACLIAYAKSGIWRPLVDLLGDETVRESVLTSVSGADEALLHELLEHAQELPAELGRRVLDAISQMLHGRWTAADLRPELSSLDAETRLAGLEGLGLIGGPEAREEIVRLLSSDPSALVRRRAAEMLSSHADDLAVLQALRTAAQLDPDTGVRRAASRLPEAGLHSD